MVTYVLLTIKRCPVMSRLFASTLVTIKPFVKVHCCKILSEIFFLSEHVTSQGLYYQKNAQKDGKSLQLAKCKVSGANFRLLRVIQMGHNVTLSLSHQENIILN